MIKCQINMIDLIKPLSFSMAYLTKPWMSGQTFFLFIPLD